MTKLLRAGIRRYFKCPVSWITLAMLVIFGCLGAAEIGPQSSPDDIYILSLMFGMTSMVTLSIGKEIGNGSVRNKIVKGYKKGQIFLSEMILAIAICFVLFIVSAVPFILIDYVTLKEIPTEALIKVVAGIILLNLALVSICVFVSCMITNRAISAVVAIVLVIGFLFVGFYLNDCLNDPEYFEVVITSNGETQKAPNAARNPNYVDGVQRKIYQFLYDVNPLGQMIQYAEILSPYFTPHAVKLEIPNEEMQILNTAPLYSIGVMIVVSSGGYVLFRKKDLK